MANTTGNHIFRIHDDNASDIRIEDWGRTAKLDANKIRTIKDVLKKGASKIATSVPSPFARMYLFDTAFTMVADNAEGDSVYHGLVSDCLDIFQLLFNAGNAAGDLKFRQWNRAERMAVLRTAPAGHPHRLLADSLNLFFTGRFADVQSVTLIYYQNILLGGTSPLTVFFTSPNWQREMREAGIRIASTTNHDEFFDDDFRPLHQRDNLFQEYLWKFYLVHRGYLNEHCAGFAAYIRNTIEKHRKDLERKASGEWADYVNNPARLDADYQRIHVEQGSSTYLHTGPLAAYAVKAGDIPAKILAESDFLLAPTVERYKEEVDEAGNPTNPYRPLALARGMNVSGTYTYDGTPWSATAEIRTTSIMDTFGNPIPLSARTLPGASGIQYPFVTTEDFLEDTLVRMPFKLHKEKFYTGYSGDFSYLLPIKKEYFNFFTKEDLKNNLTITPGERSVTVQLRVPVRSNRGGSHIHFSKTYELDRAPVAQCKAGMGIFPFYRVMDGEEGLQALNEYTVLFADKNEKMQVAALNFWPVERVIRKEPLRVPKPEPRTRKGVSAASYYYKVPAAFDLIELRLQDEAGRQFSGLIMPLFEEVHNRQATRQYTFGIDFGTSNTHIAYTEGAADRKPKPFTIGEREMQMVLLNGPGPGATAAQKYDLGFDEFPEIRPLFNREFVPSVVGRESGSYVSFPVRTATAEKNTFQSEKPELFTNINIGFYIDSDEAKPENTIYQTNLKWLFERSRNPSDPDRIEAFFKEMLMLIRNKIIMNGGSLRDSRVVWLVPLSMKQRAVDMFADKWRKAFADAFKGSGAQLLDPITESVAPYFFLKNNADAAIRDFADACNIDIGGGTTDVMFFMRKTGTYLSTSFRFAGAEIWGDGFNRNEKDNGFLRNLQAFRAESKKDRSREDVILENFLRDPALTAEDATGLLFRYDDHFRFSESITRQKPQLKLIFFLHYSAIIYHLVQIIEARGLSIPRYFTFTGKGSQYLNLMASPEALNRFTKLLLSAYTQLEVPMDFRVVLTAQPKEATAGGAVLFVDSPERDRIPRESIETAQHWGGAPEFESQFRRNATRVVDIMQNTAFNESVLRNLQAFVEKTLRDERIVDFLAQYEITNLGRYEQFLTGGDATRSGELYDSYHTMLQAMQLTEEEGAAETFFFLPLKDALYPLSKEIVAG